MTETPRTGTRYAWAAIEPDFPLPGASRRLVKGERRMAARFELEEVLGPGEVVALPPFVPHGFKALERTRAIDLFSPVSDKTGIDRS